MTETVVISSGETTQDISEEISEAIEEIEETIEEAIEEIEETIEEAIEEVTEVVEEQEDKLTWLVNSVSTMQDQVQTLSEAVQSMAALLILPPSQETEAAVLEIVKPMMDISETQPETSNTPLQEDLESVANPAPILEMETRRIVKI